VIRVGAIVIRVDDLERQKAFWTAALDYVPRDGDDDTFALLRPRSGPCSAKIGLPGWPGARPSGERQGSQPDRRPRSGLCGMPWLQGAIT
jgi:hypothetical protein